MHGLSVNWQQSGRRAIRCRWPIWLHAGSAGKERCDVPLPGRHGCRGDHRRALSGDHGSCQPEDRQRNHGGSETRCRNPKRQSERRSAWPTSCPSSLTRRGKSPTGGGCWNGVDSRVCRFSCRRNSRRRSKPSWPRIPKQFRSWKRRPPAPTMMATGLPTLSRRVLPQGSGRRRRSPKCRRVLECRCTCSLRRGIATKPDGARWRSFGSPVNAATVRCLLTTCLRSRFGVGGRRRGGGPSRGTRVAESPQRAGSRTRST